MRSKKKPKKKQNTKLLNILFSTAKLCIYVEKYKNDRNCATVKDCGQYFSFLLLIPCDGILIFFKFLILMRETKWVNSVLRGFKSPCLISKECALHFGGHRFHGNRGLLIKQRATLEARSGLLNKDSSFVRMH